MRSIVKSIGLITGLALFLWMLSLVFYNFKSLPDIMQNTLRYPILIFLSFFGLISFLGFGLAIQNVADSIYSRYFVALLINVKIEKENLISFQFAYKNTHIILQGVIVEMAHFSFPYPNNSSISGLGEFLKLKDINNGSTNGRNLINRVKKACRSTNYFNGYSAFNKETEIVDFKIGNEEQYYIHFSNILKINVLEVDINKEFNYRS
nr:hypothetical protein [Pedobacter kyonggii]